MTQNKNYRVPDMKKKQYYPKPTGADKYNRRSFIFKSVYSSLGITLSAGLFTSNLTSCSNTKSSKDEIHKQLDELVDKYFPVFGTCSQTSFQALNETFNLKADEFVKALASLPGIALRGETCGAVSGCLLGIALVFEGDNIYDKEKQKLSREPSFDFCTKFEKEFGSTRCRDIIEHVTKKKYQVSKPEDYKKLSQDGAFKNCPGVVKKAVHIAADIIMEKLVLSPKTDK